MLDLQEAHQKKVVDPENDQGTTPWNLSLGSINFVQALGSLTAHVDPSIRHNPDLEWDEPQEVNEEGVHHRDEAISPNIARQTERADIERQLEIVEVRR